MKDLIRFQIQVATGRFTLPVVILICLFLWLGTIRDWNELGSLAIIAAIGYTIIESNTTFHLIRIRTSLPVCIYGWMATSLFFLHPFEWKSLIPLVFILAVSQLFRSYESPTPTRTIYHAFLLIGLGSLILPQFIYFIPLLFGSMIPFRAMSSKSSLAGLIGLFTPYWFLFGYAFCSDQMHLFFAPLKEMVHFYPIDYNNLTLTEIISWGVIDLMFIISSFHYVQINYTDKTRTRIYHSFFIICGICTLLFSILQPIHLHALMPIQLICMAFLSGHLFTLTRNRFSGIFFIVIFVTLISLTAYNLWMQFFSF